MVINVNNRLLFNWLLPDAICGLCHTPGNSGILCPGCTADLPWLGPACRTCAIPLRTEGLCRPCRLRPPSFQSCVAAFRYEYPLAGLIQQMKFEGQPGLAQALGRLLLTILRARGLPPPDGLLPMPLHWSRCVARGYNQAQELARPLAAALDRPLLAGLCRRVRATRPQSQLAGRARHDNVRNAFALRGTPPAHIAIIDDVFTSGHTAAALSRCLRRGGAERVEVWVLARAGSG